LLCAGRPEEDLQFHPARRAVGQKVKLGQRMKKEATGFRLIFGYLGIFLMFEGFATILPLAIIGIYQSEWMVYWDFLIPGLIGIVLGALLFFVLIAGRPKGHFARNDDALLLILLWLCAIVLGALPFYFTRFPYLNQGMESLNLDMSFSESFFEAMSGYSATGLTVLPTSCFLDASELGLTPYPASHVFLFHRALMQFIGGVGLVLIVAGALSDRYNLKLYFAEGHNDKLMPNLGRSAKLIFGIYFGYILIGTLSLWLAGMPAFDAFVHATAALATGGFSTRSTSLLYFQGVNGRMLENTVLPVNSIAIEIICIVLMLLGATNFVLHTFLLTGKWKQFFKDIEIRFAIITILIFTLATTVSSLYLYQSGPIDFWTSLRYNVFNVVTSITTTGFTNYPSLVHLGEVAVFSGILLMCIGGGVGSTAGAIKQYRIALLLQDFKYSIRHHFATIREVNPNPVYRLGELKEEDPGASDEAHNYALLYIVFFLVGAMAMMFMPGIGFVESSYEFMSALSGTGIDIIGYSTYKVNFPSTYSLLLWILSFAMFVGRLEILPLYYAMRRLTHRLRHFEIKKLKKEAK
jgi:trk system potassium uptake protein TrkH